MKMSLIYDEGDEEMYCLWSRYGYEQYVTEANNMWEHSGPFGLDCWLILELKSSPLRSVKRKLEM